MEMMDEQVAAQYQQEGEMIQSHHQVEASYQQVSEEIHQQQQIEHH